MSNLDNIIASCLRNPQGTLSLSNTPQPDGVAQCFSDLHNLPTFVCKHELVESLQYLLSLDFA